MFKWGLNAPGLVFVSVDCCPVFSSPKRLGVVAESLEAGVAKQFLNILTGVLWIEIGTRARRIAGRNIEKKPSRRQSNIRPASSQPPLIVNLKLTTLYNTSLNHSNICMDCPKVHVRWWHSSHGVQHLELLATPSTKVSSLSWTKLTREESDNCEREWQALSDDEKQASMRSEPDQPVAAAVYEDGEEDLLLGVPIGKEKLFEVDVRTMSVSAHYPYILSEVSEYSERCIQYSGNLVDLQYLLGGFYGCTMRLVPSTDVNNYEVMLDKGHVRRTDQ
jgi:hypothetical protein